MEEALSGILTKNYFSLPFSRWFRGAKDGIVIWGLGLRPVGGGGHKQARPCD
jgi:hypothetical protein